VLSDDVPPADRGPDAGGSFGTAGFFTPILLPAGPAPTKIPTNYPGLCGTAESGIWLSWGLFDIATRSRARRLPALKENLMKKTLTAFVAAATMASAIAAMPTAADARCDGCAIGAGVVGGLVAGAIIGGAVANARPAPVYVEPAPVYAVPVRTCLVEQQVWSPRYQAYVMRPVRVAC
jgi:hypothetical protein